MTLSFRHFLPFSPQQGRLHSRALVPVRFRCARWFFVSAVTSLTSFGCITPPPTTRSAASGVPDPIEVLPHEVLTTPVQPDEKIIAQELRAMEAAFSRRSCPQVLEHEKRLAPLRKGTLALPLSAALALAVCEAEAAPNDKVKQERAISLLEEAQKNLVPAHNFLFLEDLKSERLTALGDSKRALESRKRMRAYIGSLDALLIKVDGDILRLSGGAEQLSAEQKARHAEALRLWPSDDALFEALKILDNLLAEVVNANARALLLQTRAAVLARIEDDFARESSLIETLLREGREPEAKNQALRMRARFPRDSYERRINALFVPPPANAAPSSDPLIPSAGTLPLDAPAAPAATAGGAVPVGSTAPTQSAPVTAEAAFDAARKWLDEGRPEEAMQTLQELPEGTQNDRTRRLRLEAVELFVRNTRTQVRNLYNRAGATTDAAQKGELLRECKKKLEDLLAKAPDAPGRSGIERNLRTINQDLENLTK